MIEIIYILLIVGALLYFIIDVANNNRAKRLETVIYNAVVTSWTTNKVVTLSMSIRDCEFLQRYYVKNSEESTYKYNTEQIKWIIERAILHTVFGYYDYKIYIGQAHSDDPNIIIFKLGFNSKIGIMINTLNAGVDELVMRHKWLTSNSDIWMDGEGENLTVHRQLDGKFFACYQDNIPEELKRLRQDAKELGLVVSNKHIFIHSNERYKR